MITLREINEDNFDSIVKMEVAPEQKRFLASNAYSLAQCWLYRDAGDVFPRAIYLDDTPIGFILFDADFEERSICIWRIMIAQAHQGKGCGTEACASPSPKPNTAAALTMPSWTANRIIPPQNMSTANSASCPPEISTTAPMNTGWISLPALETFTKTCYA